MRFPLPHSTLPRRPGLRPVAWLLATLLVAAPALAGCAGADSGGAQAETTAASQREAPRVRHVLAISIDGLNPTAIQRLGDRARHLRSLLRQGVGTLNARTEVELTRTLPNHTGMMTSRRIDPDKSGHGVVFNHDNGGTVESAAGEPVESVFTVVHGCGGRTALFSAKSKFRFFKRTWDGNIDRLVIKGDNQALARAATRDLLNQPRTFTFLHLSLPDRAGHAYGFMGRRYLDAVARIDVLVGRIKRAIKAHPGLKRDLVVVLTADHGGKGASHDNPANYANYRVPFVAWGAGVPSGEDIYDLNPTRARPGTSRPGYDAKQPIRNGDLGNLATSILGFPAIPHSQFDADHGLRINRSGFAASACATD